MAYIFLFLCPFLLSFPSTGFPIACHFFFLCLYPAVLNFNMKVSHKQFATLLAPDGPDILFSLYHECLHSIAFTHSKLLSLPCCKFHGPASPVNNDGTVSVHFSRIGVAPYFFLFFSAYCDFTSSCSYT